LGVFEIGSSELFAWGWLGTMILLISSSRVARVTGINPGVQHNTLILNSV
jgi:hypothetical protein